MKSIVSLPEYVKDYPLFSRIYSVSEDVGALDIPKEMEAWVKKTFGSVKEVEKQRIVRVDNNITFETSLFNEVRAKRPMDVKSDNEVKKVISDKKGGPFCHPTTGTPADSFGRVKGKSSISASNIAKFDAAHGLVIFREHNPLRFTLSDVKDRFETSWKWIKKANKEDSKRIYPFIMWNCLWRSAASIVHGHIQIILGKNRHYGEIERLRKFSEDYAVEFGSDYFEDLFLIHKKLGLGFETKKSRILAHLTPRKEKEVLILTDRLDNISEAVYRVLKGFLKMGVQSFNLGVYMQPLDGSWKMPIIVRIVDRGNLSVNSSDIGGTEIFGVANVISSDPFKVINNVKEEF